MSPTSSKIFQQRRKRLISAFVSKNSADFPRKHTRLLDDYFYDSYQKSQIGPALALKKNPYALVALGGYGRAEQCVFSDIDLLFLFHKTVPDEAAALVQEMVYPLWDLGLEVGYSTLALKECLAKAGRNFEMLIPLLDARFVCGQPDLYSDLTKRLTLKTIPGRQRRILSWIVQQSLNRHLQFGDSSYLLEPNLKEGQGGLRDYHTILWLGRIVNDLKKPQDLELGGYLSREEFRRLSQAVSFIWKVRNRLHHLVGRKCDQLYFEHQIKLARALKYGPTKGQQPVERFLGNLHARMGFIKNQHLIFLHEMGLARLSRRRADYSRLPVADGLTVDEGMLNFTSPAAITQTPLLLINIFSERARLNLPLSAEAKRLVKEFSYLANKKFRNSPPVLAAFEQLLVKPETQFDVLDEMLNAGLLVKLIPELKGIVDRIQYDEYHLYPVDKHSLRTVRILKNFASARENRDNPFCAGLYRSLKNKKLLLWAALLHDIGKAEPGGDHSRRGGRMVCKVLAQKNLSPGQVETVAFLVKEHLLLIKVATRRDIHDEETAIFCARKIKTINRLKMLYLLTVADSMATGPKAWSTWTSSLLRDLFLKVSSILAKGELATPRAVETITKKKESILGSTLASGERQYLEALFDFMSPRYLLYTPGREILAHIELYRGLGENDFVWQVAMDSDPDTRVVTICAKDRPGLFSKIAGIFTLNRLDILDAKVYTWRNNIALDVFKVKPPMDQLFEAEKWDQAQKHLEAALADKLDLPAALSRMVSAHRARNLHRAVARPHRIVIDNQGSSFFTIVEVFTYDFPGLLFSITDALYRCGLDVRIAKIATKVDQVVDVFYVRDFDGQKIDSQKHLAGIKRSIAEVLPGQAKSTGP